MNELNRIDIEIGCCKFNIDKATDTRDIDRYNIYYSRLQELYNERKEMLKLQTIGG